MSETLEVAVNVFTNFCLRQRVNCGEAGLECRRLGIALFTTKYRELELEQRIWSEEEGCRIYIISVAYLCISHDWPASWPSCRFFVYPVPSMQHGTVQPLINLPNLLLNAVCPLCWYLKLIPMQTQILFYPCSQHLRPL